MSPETTRETKKIEARWLSLREAARYAAIGENRLIKLAKAGRIDAGRDMELKTKPWIFDRQSIDTYRQNQVTNRERQKIVLDLADRVRV